MSYCSECGNHDVRSELRDGRLVHVCSLCAALFGDPVAVQSLTDEQEAQAAGCDVVIWPLLRCLGRLPGLKVVRHHAGDVAAQTLPFVHLSAHGNDGLLQLENLAKSLLLSARAFRLHWVLEVEYQSRLVVALKPRALVAELGTGVVGAARGDLPQIARCLDRDRRLSWWRQPTGN